MEKHTKYLVEQILKESPYQRTEIVYIALDNGSRQGPFIRKTFADKTPEIYKQMQGHQIPGIVSIYEVQDHYIIEEYVYGHTLMPQDNVFEQICHAVQKLHTKFSHPIIHRDIKPSNIIVTPNGQVKLIDFGIARQYNVEESSDTSHFGTVGYAPPEQFGFAQTDIKSDIYALGKVLDYMGGPKRIINKATSLDPADRYSSVSALLNDYKRKKHLNNPTIIVLGHVWNAFLTVVITFLVCVTITAAFLPGTASYYNNSLATRFIFFIMTIFFIFLPIYYILLFKPSICNIPKIGERCPILGWKQQLLLIIICFFLVFVLAMIGQLFNR